MRTILAASLVLTCGLSASADELLRQNPSSSTGGLSSQEARNPGGLGWFSEGADDFQVPAGDPVGINRVEFWGGYAQPAIGTFRGAVIRIYSDNAGNPGTELFEYEELGLCGETPDYTATNGAQRFHYSVDLPTPFVPPAPGTYWISVVGIVDRGGSSTDPQWGWVHTVNPQGSGGRQWFFSPFNWFDPSFHLSVVIHAEVGGGECYANCDASTLEPVLNVLDFNCFLNKFSSGDTYANCDNSTSAPTLNVLDFNCFLNRFNQGCP